MAIVHHQHEKYNQDNIVVPMTPEEKVEVGLITAEQVDQIEIDDEIEQLEQYLKNTDWYSIRYAETQVAVPEEILDNRQSARDRISILRGEE